MARMPTFLHQISPQSLIPGLFGLAILTSQAAFHFVGAKRSNFWSQDLHLNPDSTEIRFETKSVVLQGLDEVAYRLSSNYFVFIGVLLCFDALIQIWSNFRLWRGQKAYNLLEDQNSIRGPLNQTILKKIIIYSLMYFIYQAITYSNISSASKSLELPLDNLPQQARILSEKSTALAIQDLADQVPPISIKKPSLSFGKVVSSLNLDPISIFVSSNKETAFLLTRFSGELKIIDILCIEFPVIVSSLTLNRGGKYLNSTSMALSPDETKLYVSNVDFLEVIDITDLRNPVSVTIVEDKTISSSLKPDEKYPEVWKPTLLFSKDSQVLYVGGLGLQIFDISSPVAPVLISSKPSMVLRGIIIPSSLQMSADKQKLYYSNGAVYVYDLFKPREPYEFQYTYRWQSPITSMLLSKDEKTLFVLTLEENGESLFKRLAVVSLAKEGYEVKLPQKSSWPPVFLPETRSDAFLFVHASQSDSQIERRLLVVDIEEERFLLDNDKTLVKDAFDVWFSPDNRNMLVGSEEKFEIVEFFYDDPKKLAFDEGSNIIGYFEVNSALKSFIVIEEILYGISFEGQFEIYQKRAGDNKMKLLSMFPAEAGIERMQISNQKAYLLVDNKKILTLDISNLEEPRKLSEFGDSKNISGFLLSADGNTGYKVAKSTATATASLDIIDFSESANPIVKASMDLPKGQFLKTKILMSQDQKTLFLIAEQILIYDVSTNPLKPLYQGSIVVDAGMSIDYFDAVLSHDDKNLFVKFGPRTSPIKFYHFDVSNKTMPPKLLNTVDLMKSEPNENFLAQSMRLSPDSKRIYIARNQYLLVLDATGSKYVILDTIETLKERNIISNFELSTDGKTGYISAGKMIYVIGIEQPLKTIFLKEEKLLLGEKFSTEVVLMKLDNNRDYRAFEEEYKLMEFGDSFLNNWGHLGVPHSWMKFDLNKRVLTFEPKEADDIGKYRVCFMYSTKIPRDVFLKNQIINETEKSEELFAQLIRLHYLDQELFLAKRFADSEDLMLGYEYSDIKKEIYNILRQYSFQTFSLVEVIPSLHLDDVNSKLKINTPSTNSAKIDIKLNCNNQAQFLRKNYATLAPVIVEQKSRLILEGSLKNINQALEEIVVNLQKEEEECDGVITVDDKLNPPVSKSVKEITKFFNTNQAPWLDKNFPTTFQNQVDTTTIETGAYFQIKVNQSMFADRYLRFDELNYRLFKVNEEGLEVALPSWLSFDKLIIKGTPPEIISERDTKLVLAVSNEFREMRESFTLHANISTGFIVKLLIKFSLLILLIVGLIVGTKRIYNMIAKKRYRHLKDFYVTVGEQVTPEVIFPISLIGEEVQQAKEILKLLEKKRGRINLIEENLDKQRLEQIIFEGNLNMDYDAKINLILWNELVDMEIKSGRDKRTKEIYERIKDRCFEVVEWDFGASCFKINEEKFDKLLKKSEREEEDFRSGLLYFNGILLRDAIVSYAFQRHNISEANEIVQIRCFEKSSSCVKEFCNLDLKELKPTKKGSIGYGIEYLQNGNTVSFSGVVQEDIRGKILVIQFIDSKRRILKEFWIKNDMRADNSIIIGNDKNWSLQENGYEAL